MAKLSEADEYDSPLLREMLETLLSRMKRDNVTQTELGERVGTNPGMVNRVFRGRIKLVSIARLDYYALALGYKWEVRLVKRNVE